MTTQSDFSPVFEKLKSILKPYAKKLIVKIDSAEGYSLDGKYSDRWKKELFFGAAQIKKNYVSFYLVHWELAWYIPIFGGRRETNCHLVPHLLPNHGDSQRAFYLMPVYMHPDLLKNISPELKKHMQGKSCFNFKRVEKSLFDELAQLTKQGFERFVQEEYS